MSLIFNIIPNYVCGYLIPNTADKIAIVPQFPCPKLLLQIGKLTKYFTSRNTFHYLYHPGWRVLRWNLNKYMNMIFHYFHRIYPELILLSYLPKDLLQIIRNLFLQNVLPILRYPYQMVLQIIYGMFGPSNTHAVFITAKSAVWQASLLRLTANCFHPASKLAGIQQKSL
jgi:hypothetical protein